MSKLCDSPADPIDAVRDSAVEGLTVVSDGRAVDGESPGVLIEANRVHMAWTRDQMAAIETAEVSA